MKRLLCIVGGMNAGGAETFLMKIYRQLDKTLFQMDFAVSSTNVGFYDMEIKSLGGLIYHITPKTDSVLCNFRDIKRIVKENGYKYVLRVSQHSLSALELYAAKKGGARTRAFRSSNSNTAGNLLSRLTHKIFLFMPIVFSTVKIAPSYESARFMFGKSATKKNKVAIIHNGINFSDYSFSQTAREKVRKELGISHKTFVMGHIGRFSKQKNHLFLLKIFYYFHKKNNNSVLILVGDGELKQDIIKCAEELGIAANVFFTGTRSDIKAILSSFDCFVFPSLYEGMPNAIIEAQANGLSCLVSSNTTRDANITGLVEYLDLNSGEQEWSRHIIKSVKRNDPFIYKCFSEHGYTIEDVTNHFVSTIFGDDNI